MKLKINKPQRKFLKRMSKVMTKDYEYYHIPFWYRDNKDGTFDQLSFDCLPEDLKDAIIKTTR